ncbi:MAG: enoyl-CoA hydratase-related protein [Planctomycetota bacterium]|nr:enoyl-CoA hydratase-related protein [Planctomycetota bacterium]
MSDRLVLVRDDGPVRWLTLNRPAKRNALNAELVTALKEALAAPGKARCLAITGEGNTFSAGADLAALKAMRNATPAENEADSRHLAELFLQIAEHPLPIIAAMNGHALGGGAGLAVACDLTFAVPGALFGFTEVCVGFVPAIVLNFLVRTVGEKEARALCLTGQKIPVEEAQKAGILGVTPALRDTVTYFGEQFARTSPEAVAHTKRLFLQLDGLPLKDGVMLAAKENAAARATSDCREGIAAFLEKRYPRWVPESLRDKE